MTETTGMSAKERVLKAFPEARIDWRSREYTKRYRIVSAAPSQLGGAVTKWHLTEDEAWDDAAARLAPQPGEGEPIAGPNGEDMARWCPSCECKDSAGGPKCACQCHGNPFAQAQPGESAEAEMDLPKVREELRYARELIEDSPNAAVLKINQILDAIWAIPAQPVSPQVEGTEPATGESEPLEQPIDICVENAMEMWEGTAAEAAQHYAKLYFEARARLHGLLEIEDARIATGAFTPNAEAEKRIRAARAVLKPSPAAPPESESGLNIHGEPLPDGYRFTKEDESRLDAQDFYSHKSDTRPELPPTEVTEADRFMAWRWYGQFLSPMREEFLRSMAWRISRERQLLEALSRRGLSPELRERMATVKALAEKADSGPWTAVLQRPVTIADKEGEKSIQIHLEEEPILGTVRRVFYDDQRRRVTQFIAEANAHPHLKWQANTQFIAAASPDFVLELIAALEEE